MIATERLIVRAWRDADVPRHNAMCNDPGFMQFLGPPLPLAESAAAAVRQNDYIASYGSGFWALELHSTADFIGYCGIKPGPDGTPIAGEPEIGWGIAPAHWRRGYAHEAASACIDWAWRARDWPAVTAITAAGNMASRRLMERLGMVFEPALDFDHPAVPDDSPLKRHVVYRIMRPSAR